MDAFTLISKVGSLGSDMGWSEGGTSSSFVVKFCRNLDSRNGGGERVSVMRGNLVLLAEGPFFITYKVTIT